jgi:hypothetical protein
LRKKIGLWDIALAILCAVFAFKELRLHVVSVIPFVFFTLNFLILIVFGFTDLKSTIKTRKKASFISCIAGMGVCVLSYPYLIRLFFYRTGMQAMKIENFVYIFFGYYLIHFVLYLRLDENTIKNKKYFHK